ncbi:MAG TPA: hypothetical protein VKD72_29190 [Gemmataceae bacterium]|nr:hypothetical protein [Gemmataceae bacterium]
MANDRSQSESNDDRIVRVPDHRYEVGHEVDGQGKVRHQQPKA